MAEKPEEPTNEPDVGSIQPLNMSPEVVFIECLHGNLAFIFHYLYKAGGDLKIQHEQTGSTLLHVCASDGFDSMATKILEHPDVDSEFLRRTDHNGDTCLHVAAIIGQHRIMAQILAHPCSANLCDQSNDTTLHTPLHLAVKYSNIKCIEVLLRNNSDITKLNNELRIPIEYVHGSFLNRLDVLNMFLRFGIHPFSKLSFATLIAYTIEGVEQREIRRILWYEQQTPARRLTHTFHLAIKHRDLEITKYLLEHHRASVNAKDERNHSALHYATDDSSQEMVELILPLCDDVNAVIDRGTALHLAAGSGHLEVLRLLLEAGAKVNVESEIGAETPLHMAARAKSEDCFSLLTHKGADNMKENSDGHTALEILYEGNRVYVGTWLSQRNNVLFVYHSFRRAVIRLMFNMKGNFLVNQAFILPGVCSTSAFEDFIDTHKEDFIMLLYVLTRLKCIGTSRDLIEFFRHCNMDPKQFRLTTKTEGLLASSIANPDANLIRFLLTFPDFVAYKSSPDSLNEGEKAIQEAVKRNRVDLLKILLEGGLVPKDVPGITVADKSCIEVTRYLFETVGVPANQTVQPYNMSLLQYAIVHKHFTAIALLLNANASFTTKDDFGFTPLHDAVWIRDVPTAGVMRTPETINAQLSFGSTTDVYALDGATPLHLACRSIHQEMVVILLQEGARVDMYDNAGRLPLDYAFMQNDWDTITTLISAGADIRMSPEAEIMHDPGRCDDGHDMLCILKRCGFPTHKFTAKLNLDSPRNEPYFKNEPRTLQDICGAEIRRSLWPNAWVGIRDLPLPEVIKEFITLEIAQTDSDLCTEDSDYRFNSTCRLVIHKEPEAREVKGDDEEEDEDESDEEPEHDDPMLVLYYDD